MYIVEVFSDIFLFGALHPEAVLIEMIVNFQGYSKVCRCNGNWGGDGCDIDLTQNATVVWTLLYDVERIFASDTLSGDLTGDSPPDIQFGHSLLVSEPSNHIWLFGGVSQMNQDSNR